MNIGLAHQVPALEMFIVEANSHSCSYDEIDSRINLNPKNDTYNLVSENACRLVYSLNNLCIKAKEQSEQQRNLLCEGDPQKITKFVPQNNNELNLYIKHVFQNWPVWIVWPPTVEFALKLLCFADYDCVNALKILCSPRFPFRRKFSVKKTCLRNLPASYKTLYEQVVTSR